MAEQIVLAPNLAKKASVRNWFKKELAPLIKTVREEKNDLIRPQWLRYYNVWALRGTEASYHGRLRMYTPIGHRIVENWVQKLRADLFPESGKWFKNVPDSTTQQDRSVVVHELMMKMLRTQMKVQATFPGLLRNLCIFGTAPVEMGWKHEEWEVPTLQHVLNQQSGETAIEEVMRKTVQYLGPTLRVIDPFLFYVYPYTAQQPWECELLFEDMMVGWATLERMSKTPIDPERSELGNQIENWKGVKELRGGSGSDVGDKFQGEQIRLQARGLMSKSDKLKDDPKRPMDFTKIAWYGTLEAHATENDDDTYPSSDTPQWWQLWVVGDDCLVHARQNPWWKQRPPYLASKFCEMQGEFWGYGVVFLLEHFQNFMNDTMNQTGDGLVFSLNPIVAMDANAVQFPDSIRMSPAARWLIRDPRNNVQFIEPPKDSAASGIQVINFLVAMMNDVSNVSPFGSAGMAVGGRSRGRAVQTATGMSILSGEALLQVRDVVANLEQGVMNEMLDWMFSLMQQCLDRDLILRVAGTEGSQIVETTVSRDSLVGTYTFEWLGSQFSFNQNVRTQQMLNFIQILAKIPPEFLAQDNARVDWKYLLREIWATGFGDRESQMIIKDINPTRAVDASIEDELFGVGRGEEVTVSSLDDDMAHANVHNAFLQSPEGMQLPEFTKGQVMVHIQRHAASYAMKQMAKQQQEEQAAIQQLMAGAQAGRELMGQGNGAQGGPGAPPGGAPPNGAAPGSMTPSGNVMPEPPGRPPQTANAGDIERRLPRGVME
jgi:hypothetical protein